MKNTIDRIAKERLRLDTLETRRRDSLDFHDLSVWCIRAALEAAYKAGARSKRQPHERELASVLKKLHGTGQRLIDVLGHTICADEPEFSKFSEAVSTARQYLKGEQP